VSSFLDLPASAPAVHTGIVTARFFETWDFYTTLLDFRTIDENDGYVRLQHPSGVELIVLQHELNGDWSELVSATDGRGIWLRLEVEDPASEFERMRAAGIETMRADRGKWRTASFVFRDPNGILIFVAARNRPGRQPLSDASPV
jgi:catechol 2,3-dioxygenase-like lactoylglutathione lyase family enzyme